MDRLLDRCDALNKDARGLPRSVRDRRLRAETAVIVSAGRAADGAAAPARSAGRARQARTAPRLRCWRSSGGSRRGSGGARGVSEDGAAARGSGRRQHSSTGRCACSRRRGARRCSRSTPTAAWSTTSPTATSRTRRRAGRARGLAGRDRRALRRQPPASGREGARRGRSRRFGLRDDGLPRASSTAWRWTRGRTSEHPRMLDLDLYCDRVASAVGRLSVRDLRARRRQRAAASRTAWAGHCSSPTSCATSPRTPPAAGSICRPSCWRSTGSRRASRPRCWPIRASAPSAASSRAWRGSTSRRRTRRWRDAPQRGGAPGRASWGRSTARLLERLRRGATGGTSSTRRAFPHR